MTDGSNDVSNWLRRLQAGDSSVLGKLYEYYRPRLRQLVRLRMDSRLAARVDPSDVLQEAYMDAVRRIAAYLNNPQVSAFVWLRGLAMNRLRKFQRQHLGTLRRDAARELPLPVDQSAVLAGQLLARGLSPSQVMLKKELKSKVQRAIARLRPADREVILMRHFEGLSNAEVAEALKIGVSGATMRHGRALHNLKQLLTTELERDDMP
jgi:RNA polymerase sigma-70 factor (ECF subfamily)